MNVLSDGDLLRQFAKDDSEAAFAILVERYLGLVHSVALRQTNDPQHAQDISQAVFIILARKAGTLDSKTILSGWLYHTARLTAANFQRTEWRRARREQEAFMQSETHVDSSEDAWRELSPQLETAMAKLTPADRDALVMRYFQNRSMAEVGTALGWTENTAQQRVGRDLEKLRKFFGKRGVMLTGGTIATALSANALQAAPAGLTKAITTVAVAKGATASISTANLVKATLKVMLWSNLTLFVSLAFLSVSSAIGVGVAFVRLISESLKREDTGEAPPHQFLDRHNVIEWRKKYSKQFGLFVVLAFVCFVFWHGLAIWLDLHPDAAVRWAPWRNLARGTIIAVFLVAVAVVWRKMGGAGGWRTRILKRNEMIVKQLWDADPNPAMPAHYDEDFRTTVKLAGFVFLIPWIGVLICVVSFIGVIRQPCFFKGLWQFFTIFIAGSVLGVIGSYLTARQVRKKWLLTDARYIKHLVKWVTMSGGGGGGGFSCIVICEYKYAGIKYRVTPKITPVALVSFPTAQIAERYVKKRISSDGTCKLHFNPDNPLQATLYNGGFIDRLLVSHRQRLVAR